MTDHKRDADERDVEADGRGRPADARDAAGDERDVFNDTQDSDADEPLRRGLWRVAGGQNTRPPFSYADLALWPVIVRATAAACPRRSRPRSCLTDGFVDLACSDTGFVPNRTRPTGTVSLVTTFSAVKTTSCSSSDNSGPSRAFPRFASVFGSRSM